MGSGSIFLGPITGRLVRRGGLRRVFLSGYLLGSVSTFLVAAARGHPSIGGALIVCAALGMSAIDAGGTMLFLLSVRCHARAELTTVYPTYPNVPHIVPPRLSSLPLRVFEPPAVRIRCCP